MFRRRRLDISLVAGALPVVSIAAWLIVNASQHTESLFSGFHARVINNSGSIWAALLFNCYALFLGIDLLVRGIRANSIARANFGLLIIAALAIARFFDTDLNFLTRGLGFIVVGIGFLVANVIFFKRRAAT